MAPPPIATSNSALAASLGSWREAGAKIALIPTMGALHDGHLAHVLAARNRAERVVVSVFVNPTQFAPTEDLARYPRDLEGDALKLAGTGGVDLIFAPRVEDIYPDGVKASPAPEGPASGLESDFRPHFFGGVIAVVERLFRLVQPDIATFGEKDYQQLLVVRQLVERLGLSIDIVPVPIVRDADGLALSSRNAYLSSEQRRIAPSLYETLLRVAERARSGHGIPESEAEGAATLLSAGFDRIDYCAIRAADTLRPLKEVSRPARALAAAWIGATRLIDNVPVLAA